MRMSSSSASVDSRTKLEGGSSLLEAELADAHRPSMEAQRRQEEEQRKREEAEEELGRLRAELDRLRRST